jgi:hypothetical protein
MPISQIVTNSIANDAVVTADIADGAVTTAKIAAGAVVADDIANGAVTRAKMGYAGAVLQVVSAAKTDTFTTTGTSFVDVTGLSVSITPSSTSSRIMIICCLGLGALINTYAAMPRLARNGTGIFIPDAAGSRIRAAAMYEMGNANTTQIALNFLDSPNTTSATTYNVQLMSNTSGQPARVNASSEDRDSSVWSRSVSSITVMEIAG